MTEESDVVGTASIDISVGLSGLEELEAKLDAALETLKKNANLEVPVTAKSSGGTTASGGGTTQASKVGVDAEVKSVSGLDEAVRRAISGPEGGWIIKINEANLRGQIENALKGAFKITVEIEGMPTDLRTGGSPTPGATTPEVSRTAPAAYQRAINPKAEEQIYLLHTTVREAFEKVGRSWGSAGDRDFFGQFQDLVKTFGPISDWAKLQVTMKSGATQTRMASSALLETLTAAGVPADELSAVRSATKELVQTAAGGTGGQTLTAFSRTLATELAREQSQTPPASAPPVKLVAANVPPPPAPPETPRPVRETPPAQPAEAPTSESRAPVGGARIMGGALTLDQAIAQVAQRMSALPAGRTTGPTPRNPFDYDPQNKEWLSGTEVMERNQGRMPTPRSARSRYSYSQLLRAAQLGAFNNWAMILNDEGKFSGEFAQYDPTAEDQATAELMKGRTGRLAGGQMARGLKPATFAEMIVRGASGTRNRIVPEATLRPAPGGREQEAEAIRVIEKLLPRAASAFTYGNLDPRTGKPFKAGDYSGTPKTLEDSVRLDMKYIEAFQALVNLEDEKAGRSLSPRQAEVYDRRIAAQRGRLTALQDEGADPSSVIAWKMTPEQRIQALRERRASQIETNAEARERIEGRVGIHPDQLAKERREAAAREQNAQIAANAKFRMEDVTRRVLEGTLPVSRENLPEGYEDLGVEAVTQRRDIMAAGPFRTPDERERLRLGSTVERGTKPRALTTRSFITQHLTQILDEFRRQIGEETGRGTTDIPREFGEILGPVKQGIFAAISEAGPGGPATRRGTPDSLRGALRSPSFAEQDRRAEEGRAHRGTTGTPVSSSETEREAERRRSEAEAHRLPVTPTIGIESARLRAEIAKRERGLFLEQRPAVAENDREAMRPYAPEREIGRQLSFFGFNEAEERRSREQEDARRFRERSARARNVPWWSQSGVRPPEPAGERWMVGGPEEPLFRGAPGAEATPETPRAAIGQVSMGFAAEEQLAANERLQRVAQRLIRHESARYSRTGEETAARIAGRRLIPGALRTEALEQIEGGYVPGFKPKEPITGMTGDRTREVTGRTAFVPSTETPPPQPEAGAAGGAGGGGRRTAGGAGAAGGGDRERTPSSGKIEVYWTSSMPVTITGAQGPSAGGTRWAQDQVSRFNYARGEQAIRDTMPERVEDARMGGPMGFVAPGLPGKTYKAGRARRFLDKIMDEGVTDIEHQRDVMQAAGYNVEAAIMLPRQRGAEGGGGAFGGTTGTGGALRDLNSRRARAGLQPVAERGEEFYEQVDVADQRRAELMSLARRAERGIPKRGFTASVTDIFSNLGGMLDEQVASVSRFQREGSELSTMLRRGPEIERQAELARKTLMGSRRQLSAMEGPIEVSRAERKELEAIGIKPEDVRAYNEAFNALNRDVVVGKKSVIEAQTALKDYNTSIAAQEKRVKAAEEALPGAGARIGAFAIGGLAASGAFAVGQVIAQLTGQILGAVQQAAAAAIGPVAERMTGFTATEARVTGGLAQAFSGAGGAPGAIAGAVAPTGISGAAFARIGPTLITRAEVEAGNKALAEQIDLLHAFEQAQRAGAQQGIYATTGGFGGTMLGGVASTQELIKNELNAGETYTSPLIKQGQFDTEVGSAAARQIGGAYLPNLIGEQGLTSPGAIGDVLNQAQIDTSNRLLQQRVDYFNDAISKGGEGAIKFATRLDGVTEGMASQFADAARKAGLTEIAAAAEGVNRVVLTDESGTPILDPEKIRGAVVATNIGAQTPTPELFFKSQERQIMAQVQLEQAMRQRQLGTLIPAQFGLRETLAPTGDITAPLRAAGVGGLGGLEKQLGQINAQADVGRAKMISFVVDTLKLGTTEAASFSANLALAASYGKQISDLQIGIQTEQAAYQAKQYSFQIYQVRRSLQDAKGLTGEITADNGRNLGVLERQQFLLQRQSQSLSLELSQRQINYQVAVAGFSAPGVTPEERAANVEAAKIEAEYAQKQLDIQKQLFGLQGRTFRITASRQVQDLGRQLGLLQEGRELVLHTAKAEARIKVLAKLMEEPQARVEAYYSAATQVSGQILQLGANAVAATGRALMEVSKDAAKAFASYYYGIIDTVTHPGGSGSGGASGNRAGTSRPSASGGVWSASTPNTVLFGEAGPETVAVIRNARPGMMPSDMGGGGGLVVNFNAPINVRDDSDIDTIVRKVQQAMGRDAALRGLRQK